MVMPSNQDADRRRKGTSLGREANRRRKIYGSSHSSMQMGDGKKALEVLSGDMIVPELKNTKDSIGTMTDVCTYCKALKWSKETSTFAAKMEKSHSQGFHCSQPT